MKLTHIKISNFLGCRHAAVRLTTPITVFAGANGAGKSSIFEAIRLGLTNDVSRVALKKQYGDLVSKGAAIGSVEIIDADGCVSIAEVPSGKFSGPSENPVLPFVFDAQRFARLQPADRRSFLFGVMGVKTSREVVSATMLARGANAAKVDKVLPFLRSGFDAAQKEAATQARESKSSWKTVTGGEAYGSVKAESWEAPRVDVPALGAIDAAKKALADAEAESERLTLELGAVRATNLGRAESLKRIADMTEKAGLLARRKAKLAADMADRAHVQKAIDACQIDADAGVLHACPCCMAMLRLTPAGLVKADAESSYSINPDADPSRLPAYHKSLGMLVSAIANDARDIAESENAAAELAKITAPKEAPASEADLMISLGKAKTSATIAKSALAALQSAESAALAAENKTSTAMTHHKSVTEWEVIADLLAPNGIPAALLAQALEPLNARLTKSANIAGWSVVKVGDDMEITAIKDGAPRAYALLSESEKWRCDALIAEAVSWLSGTKLVALDRFDVLDLAGRGDLIHWLSTLADLGEIDTALIFGTLKSLPQFSNAAISAYWIQDGVIAESAAVDKAA